MWSHCSDESQGKGRTVMRSRDTLTSCIYRQTKLQIVRQQAIDELTYTYLLTYTWKKCVARVIYDERLESGDEFLRTRVCESAWWCV